MLHLIKGVWDADGALIWPSSHITTPILQDVRCKMGVCISHFGDADGALIRPSLHLTTPVLQSDTSDNATAPRSISHFCFQQFYETLHFLISWYFAESFTTPSMCVCTAEIGEFTSFASSVPSNHTISITVPYPSDPMWRFIIRLFAGSRERNGANGTYCEGHSPYIWSY